MTILTTNKLLLTFAATFLFGALAVTLAIAPGMEAYQREFAPVPGIFSAVAALLSCYFLVEKGRHRTLLMLLAVTAFCFALPLLIVLLVAGN